MQYAGTQERLHALAGATQASANSALAKLQMPLRALPPKYDALLGYFTAVEWAVVLLRPQLFNSWSAFVAEQLSADMAYAARAPSLRERLARWIGVQDLPTSATSAASSAAARAHAGSH